MMEYYAKIHENVAGGVEESYLGAAENRFLVRLCQLTPAGEVSDLQLKAALGTQVFLTNWLKLRAWTLRQIQHNIQQLYPENGYFKDNWRQQFTAELLTHHRITVGLIENSTAVITSYQHSPLAEGETPLGNSGLTGSQLTMVLQTVQQLLTVPTQIKVNIEPDKASVK